MKIPPAVRATLESIEDLGQATIEELIASDHGARTRKSWCASIWRAKELGLLESVVERHVATYTVTEVGREVLGGRVIHRGAPAVSMVAYALRNQPTSVWALARHA